MVDEIDKPDDDSTIRGEFTTGTPGSNDEVTTGINISGEAAGLLRQAASGPNEVSLQRTASQPTEDQPLWVAIRNRAKSISFERYDQFVHAVLCEEGAVNAPQREFSSPSLSSRLQIV